MSVRPLIATVLVLFTQLGCSRAEVEPCAGPFGDVAFTRDPGVTAGCQRDGRGILVVRTEKDWREHCGEPVMPIAARKQIAVGIFLENDCTYSGCEGQMPLIEHVERRSCTLTVMSRDVGKSDLGPCNACVQPRDVILVPADAADAVVEWQ